MIRAVLRSALVSEAYRLMLRLLEFAVPDPCEVDRLVEILNGEEEDAGRSAR